jgi:uncharacterized protein YtpQ (UPF0354 family)
VAYLKATYLTDDAEPALELAPKDSPVFSDFLPGMAVAYLVDQGDSYSYVQYRHLWEDGLEPSELSRVGLENLAELASNSVEVRGYGDIYVVTMGGTFEAALLLVDAFWEDWYNEVASEPVLAAAPARDILAFGSAEYPAVRSALAGLARRLPEFDHPLSDTLLLRADGAWSLDNAS